MYAITIRSVVVGEDTPLEDVFVRMIDTETKDILGEGTTDSDGEIVFDIPEGTVVEVRPFLRGYSFPNRMRITADEDATYIVEGADQDENPSATDPLYCRITGFAASPRGVRLPGAVFVLTPTALFDVVGDDLVVGESIPVKTSTTGRIDITLPRKAVFEVNLDGDTIRVRVPDSTWCALADFLRPVLVTATVPDESVTVSVGSTDTQVLSASISRTSLPFDWSPTEEATCADYVSAETSNHDVVSAEVKADGTLVLTGLSAGSCTVTLIEKPGACARRSPEPVRTLSTITVTVTA
ncbi:hypothetical protein EBT31_07570 [bacterium]|nr:hypothetical protein [bacterium]